jgi:hypothetical protein
MGTDETIEYTCSECNTAVGKEDKVCPKCAADLTESYAEAKFDQIGYRVLFDILLFPAALIAIGLIEILSDIIVGTFSNDIDSRYFTRLGISAVVITSANILYAFWFLNINNKKRVISALVISIISISLYDLFNRFIAGTIILVISSVILNEYVLFYYGKKGTILSLLVPA